jgi:hypothetical protein
MWTHMWTATHRQPFSSVLKFAAGNERHLRSVQRRGFPKSAFTVTSCYLSLFISAFSYATYRGFAFAYAHEFIPLREGCITSRYAPSVTDAERLRDSYNIIAYLRYYIPAARCDTSCCDRGHPLLLHPSPNYRMMTFSRWGALRDKANSRRAGSTRSSLRNSWRSINDVEPRRRPSSPSRNLTSTEAEVSRHLTRYLIGRLLAAFHRRDKCHESYRINNRIIACREHAVFDRITIHHATFASGIAALTSNSARKGHLRDSASRLTYNWSQFTWSLNSILKNCAEARLRKVWRLAAECKWHCL